MNLLAQIAPTAIPQPRPGGGTTPRDIAEVQGAARELEAFFVSQMVAVMFAGMKTDGPFGGGDSEKIFRGMLQDEYGKAIAKSGRLGIADSVVAQMLKAQEGRQS